MYPFFFIHLPSLLKLIRRACYVKKKNSVTAQKMKFSIKDFFSKCDQSLIENFIFCAVPPVLWDK